MDLQQQTDRAAEAALLLENRLLNDALAAIEQEVISQWEQCPARDKEGKEALWQLFKTSKKFRSILSGYVETGKLATAQLAKFEERRTFRDLLRRA